MLGDNPNWGAGEWFHHLEFGCLLNGKKYWGMREFGLDRPLLGMQMLGLIP